MNEVYVVRHNVQVEGLSVRRVAREMGISRNTVRRYLEGAEPGVRKEVDRPRPVFDAVRGRMAELLGDSPKWTGGKQRLTAARLHEMLVDEGHVVGVTAPPETLRREVDRLPALRSGAGAQTAGCAPGRRR